MLGHSRRQAWLIRLVFGAVLGTVGLSHLLTSEC